MNISRKLVDKELRSSFGMLKVTGYLMSRNWGIRLLNKASASLKGKKIESLQNQELYIPDKNGRTKIRLRIFKPSHFEGKLPVVLYLHGGGYVIGNPESFLTSIKGFIESRPCIVVAPDYRKALSAPYPAAFDDCYDTLLWIKNYADSIGADSSKIIIAGHSAGGGLTAALALKARDTQEVKIAFQIPIYPMIDDRQTTPSAMGIDLPGWNTKTNAKAWSLYLKELLKDSREIPAYASPARNTDYKGLPPTITFVGEYDTFKDETIAYVEALKKENVQVKFKFYNACYHGFDLINSEAAVSRDAIDFTYSSFAEYYDKYITP